MSHDANLATMLANPNNADAAMQTGKQRHSPQFTLLAKVTRNEEHTLIRLTSNGCGKQ